MTPKVSDVQLLEAQIRDMVSYNLETLGLAFIQKKLF